ncbi:protein YIPF5 homolog [Culicoides brevitarsis]|uniref:protein YIPF5 homolog n=1 Tax=Culicoides brevitarsis TaxID=469753 RepID=UPI00307B1C39
MSGYTNNQFWEGTDQYNQYDGTTNFMSQSQTLDFQSFDQSQYDANQYSQPSAYRSPNIFTPPPSMEQEYGTSEFDEAPLLDELEIYPTRILEKSLAVLNPFHAKGLADDPEYLFKETDLAGPIAFCLCLAACLFLSGNKAQFGYIYGLSIISVIVMYFLISLMCYTQENHVTLSAVASILGYSILPIVWLSILGVFVSLNSSFGIVLAIVAIVLSTTASSRIFCLMTGDANQRFLIAYPCGLVYVIFALLVLF